MTAFSVIQQNALALKLTPIHIRELLYITNVPFNVFALNHNIYEIVIQAGQTLDKITLKEFIHKGFMTLYIEDNDKPKLIENQKENLRGSTRSLSIGDPIEKGKRQFALLTINLGHFYEDTSNDDSLALLTQSTKNLFQFLYGNPTIHRILFDEYIKQHHHYIFAQPLISSLFLLGALKQSRSLGEKEIENLFLTSYFKDVGMSAIPTAKYDSQNLSDQDKILLLKHPTLSVNILEGRLPLRPTYLKIIENHHLFTLLGNKMAPTEDILSGFETMMISITDVISAMVSERPYRPSLPVFRSLEYVKLLIADQYPSEFRLLVNYFRQFYSTQK